MNVVEVYTLCVIFLSEAFYTAQDGNSCYNKEVSQNGKCISLEDCPSARERIKLLRKPPQICGFIDKIPLVCCVQGIITRSPTRKSEEMCKQYQVQVKNILKEKCPDIPIQPIGSGEPAEDGEFPHMVALGFNMTNSTTEYLCGGTLISKNFVLTAAHCLYTASFGSPITVRVGALVLNSENDTESQEIRILKIYKHPEYKRPAVYNDIGLLQLEKDVTFSVRAYPACLSSTKEIEDYSEVEVTGWGNTNAWGDKSDTLMKIKINVIPHNNCSTFHLQDNRRLTRGLDSETHICAASLGTRKDSCSGDSGGPLKQEVKEFCMYNVLGVTSFGKPCLLSGAPGVYTKVFPYLDWIEKIVWP